MARFGWKPDKPDARDRLFIPRIGLEPAAHSLRPFVREVLDQGETESCVAHAEVQAVRVALAVRGYDAPLVSPRFVYFNARAFDGDQDADMGTYLRSGMRALAKFGGPPAEQYPLTADNVNNQPEWNAYRLGYDFAGIHQYARIVDEPLAAIRASIAAGLPVVAGWMVDEGFLDSAGPAVQPAITGQIIGGHALCIVGYDADGNFELVNSWGIGYRDGGFFKASPEFILQGSDLWCVDPS